MNGVELFKYPLYPIDSKFNEIELAERVLETLTEIKLLLPELEQTQNVEFKTAYEVGENFFYLVLTVYESRQGSFAFDCTRIDVLEFRKNIIEKIHSLPILLNSLVLDAVAASLSIDNPTDQKNPKLKKLIQRKQGSTNCINVDGCDQFILFPGILTHKIDPIPRVIECNIIFIGRYEVIINGVKDSAGNAEVKFSKKLRLDIRKASKDHALYEALSKKLGANNRLTLKVTAVLDALSNVVREYQLIECLSKSVLIRVGHAP